MDIKYYKSMVQDIPLKACTECGKFYLLVFLIYYKNKQNKIYLNKFAIGWIWIRIFKNKKMSIL